MADENYVSLDTIGQGAAIELFNVDANDFRATA